MVAITTTATDHRADVAVDGFDLSERDLDVAVGQDAVEVTTEKLGDLGEGREPLPPQRVDPGGQEAPRRAFVGVVPEVRQLFLEQMGFGEPTVEREKVLEFVPLPPLEIAPRPEQQPPLTAQKPAGRAALAEELGAPCFVQRVVDVAQDVELV